MSGKAATAEMALRGRIGGFSLAATHDAREYTKAARRAFLAKFLADIPADLPEDERLRRARAARQAHFARLALKSAKARRQRKSGAAK